MTELNIFDSAPPQQGEFKKWDKIGAEVQGTYIDVREGIDGYGNPQMIYVLKDKEDKIWNVAFKKTNTVILDRMAGVHLGQIVGFRYEEDRPSKKVEGKIAKIIRVYYSNDIVDKVWLEEQKKLKEQFGDIKPPTPSSISTINVPSQPSPIPTTVDNTAEAVIPGAPETKVNSENTANPISAIRALAITQGLISADLDVGVQDAKIIEYTGLNIEEANFTQIIIKLTGYIR